MVSLISKIGKRIVVDIDHKDAKKVKVTSMRPVSNGALHGSEEVSVRVPTSISILAFGRKDGLPDYVLQCPQVQSLIKRGWLHAVAYSAPTVEQKQPPRTKKSPKEGKK